MKKTSRIITFIIISVIVFACVLGTIIYHGVRYAGNYQKMIYNDNSKISSQADSYSYRNSSSNHDNTSATKKFKYFTGMDTIYKLTTEKDTTVKINYNITIKSGKFKIVIIDPNDTVTTLIEGEGKDTKEIKLLSGKTRIKIVGTEAKGECKIDFDDTNDIDINYSND